MINVLLFHDQRQANDVVRSRKGGGGGGLKEEASQTRRKKCFEYRRMMDIDDYLWPTKRNSVVIFLGLEA